MTTTLELPTIAARGMISPIGLALVPGAISRQALERVLSPAVVSALQVLLGQVEVEAIDPLLYKATPQQLGETFQRVYWKFVPPYLSAAFALMTALQQSPQQTIAVSTGGLSEIERMLRDQGPARIGTEATTAALMGLETITRIIQRSLAVPPPVVPAELAGTMNQWGMSVLSYMLALLTVASFLSRPDRGGAENARVLAHWSRQFAAQVYHLSKVLGQLPPAPAPGPLPTESDEEDLRLANAGLDHYRELLPREEPDDGAHQG